MNTTFQTLAAEVGIDLPAPLSRILATGKTEYGPAWSEEWRDRCLSDPPPLISCLDFEWISADQSKAVISEWLNPQFQSGQIFLPFAQSGAGDSYCLMLIDANQIGVAVIKHDWHESSMHSLSFSDFVCTEFLTMFSDLGGWLDNNQFTEDEVLQIVRADVRRVAACMEPIERNYLISFCSLEPVYRQFKDRPRSSPREVFSIISQEQLAREMLNFHRPNSPAFPIIARWDVPSTNISPEVVTWKTLALDPVQKMKAIRAYQAEHAVNLATAKLEVERYVINHQGSN